MLAAIAFVQPLAACLWDSETLEQERARFPGTLELITGKFLRHSPDYYAWRLEDRKRKLEDEPTNDALLDDLAVSYEKLGQHAEAIAVAREQLERNPDRYETLANLGTFLIHDGQWKEGLAMIDRAIEVNPDAHFGREKYQRFLVLYLMELFPDGQIEFPLVTGERRLTFPEFLSSQLYDANDAGNVPRLEVTDRQAAIDGVLGMMRFSDHQHPVLREVLGQLLTETYHPQEDAKQLAARSYISLAAGTTDPLQKAQYEKLARAAIDMQTQRPRSTTQMSLAQVKAEFEKEQRDADAWYKELEANEKQWIAEGKDVDAEYRKRYREQPASAASATNESGGVISVMIAAISILVALVVVIPFGVRFVFSDRKRLKTS